MEGRIRRRIILRLGGAMTFNAVAAILDADKTYPEPVQLPDALEGGTPQDLAEARSRLLQLAQVARELVKTIDVELVAHLDGGALRYGDSLLRPAGRGRPRIVDKTLWWDMVTEGVLKSDNPAGLLSSLYPADSVRLTALMQLAEVLDIPEQSIRSTMIDYEPPTALISVMPMSRAPKWAQALSEGQLSNQRGQDA